MIGIDDDYSGAPIARHNGCWKTRRSRSDNHHIRRSVPLDSGLRRGICFLPGPGQTGRAYREGGAFDEFSSAGVKRVAVVGHVPVLSKVVNSNLHRSEERRVGLKESLLLAMSLSSVKW